MGEWHHEGEAHGQTSPNHYGQESANLRGGGQSAHGYGAYVRRERRIHAMSHGY